ncbi:hypothetical protein KP806_11515 [Paenibacillus sp. N4]|uniref:hypothetical protein n=1 Tax=Paenibacillus vietnamensis TaxID=2590547 RepID=UPI001CD06AC0|nr:hypothetical protein [Paenibacillus vietnamensis]MCA0755683.1 hypothetical protein [Paenibacillus vietnamensis]
MYAIADQLESVVQRRYDRWRSAELPPYLKKELNELKTAEITDRFYKHIQLDAEGMKGKIGVGTNRVNRFSIRRVAGGLADEIKSRGFAAQQRGAVIGFDARSMSRGFAEEAALVLAEHNIKAYLFERPVPTPMLAFAVRALHAAAGVMITAGNHSSDYNGLKIYGENGDPLQEELVSRVSGYMEAIYDGLQVKAMSAEEALATGRLVMAGTEMEAAYLQHMGKIPLCKETNQLMGSSVRIVHLALQGAGGETLIRALRQEGFTEVHAITEERMPGGPFARPARPDPYNPVNLAAAYEYAAKLEADLIIATNPELNELSLSVKIEPGKYALLSGSETAALLAEYMLMRKKSRNTLPRGGIVLKSALAGDLISDVIARYGQRLEEVPAGFRQIARKLEEQENDPAGGGYLFGMEEYGGYAVSPYIRDKDAIQASLLIAEMAAYYKSVGLTVYKQLIQISRMYGWYAEDRIRLTFYGLEGWQQVKLAMQRLRTEAPKTAGGQKALKLLDYRTCEPNGGKRRQAGSPEAASCNLLKFALEDGSWYAFRQSSSEPAITVYFSSRDKEERACRHKLSAIRSDVLYHIESIV